MQVMPFKRKVYYSFKEHKTWRINKWRINHIYEWKAQYHKMKFLTQINL